MNCPEFKQQLEQAIAARDTDEKTVARLGEHVTHCQENECRRAWEDHQLLQRMTDAWRQTLPQADLRERVVGELRALASPMSLADDVPWYITGSYRLVQAPPASRPPTGRRAALVGPRPWSAMLMVAAVVMLLVTLFSVSPSRRSELSNLAAHDTTAGDTTTRDTPADDTAPGSIDTDALLEGRDRLARHHVYAVMPLTAATFLTDTVSFVVPADLANPDDEPSSADVWADRIGEQLEPLGRDLSSAFEALLDAVPKSPATST